MPDVPSDLLERHFDELIGFAITPEVLAQAGVRSIERPEDLPHGVDAYWKDKLPAKLYPWSMNGRATWQLAPDDRSDGPKYLFPEGSEPPLNCFRDAGDGPVLIVEGTKQHLSAASYAPAGHAIYGMFGCWGWSGRDLSFVNKRPVYVILDADLASNRDVWNAGKGLQDMLEAVGAIQVLFVSLPGEGKTGLDDFLATIPEHTRSEALATLLSKAQAKLPRAPAKKTGGPKTRWFDDSGSFLALDVALALQEAQPLVLTRENRIAVYRRGVYRMNPSVFMGAIVKMLKNDYRPNYRATVEEVIIGLLGSQEYVLPDRLDTPLLNCTNGMVDLRNGKLSEHDPSLLSALQIPIEYDPQATCPLYETWAAQIIGNQLDLLEETASMMLDPSRTPDKALLLYGPSRSGKSTFLRLLECVVGNENVANVSLHELSDDQFAAAQLYGKMLNTSADLSARHVEDISRFKMMTGEDMVRGNRKYGKDFFFRNQAMFAFSTNEIPTVGESSRAYNERMVPFRFGHSYAGHVDYTLEPRMRQELPGILARLIRAWKRRAERGHDLSVDTEVQSEFERASDRVTMWLEEEMEVILELDGVPVIEGGSLPTSLSTTPTVLSEMFARWANENHMAGMGRTKLMQRLTSRPEIVNVRQEKSRARALNLVRMRPGGKGSPLGPDVGSVGQSSSPTEPKTAHPHLPAETPGPGPVAGRVGSFGDILPIPGTKSRGDDPIQTNETHLSPTYGENVSKTAHSAREGAPHPFPPAEMGVGSFEDLELATLPNTAQDEEN